MKVVMFTTVLMLLAISTPAYAGCEYVSMTSPGVVEQGTMVPVTFSMTNCSTKAVSLVASISIQGPGFSFSFRLPVRLPAGFTVTKTVNVPAYHLGTYSLTVSIGGSTATAVMTVVP